MGAKEHYDNHLGNFYTWMMGDLSVKVDDFYRFLNQRNISAQEGDVAVDLGAGNGVQTIALAKCGYQVKAIDFNKQLVDELTRNTEKYSATVIYDDFRNIRSHAHNAAVVTCCGDTITHLDSNADIAQLVVDIYSSLKVGGSAVFSFRDYSRSLEGVQRFIPVRSDDSRILTCVLDYLPDSVIVTDLLHERVGSTWRQSVSSYQKVILERGVFVAMLERSGFTIRFNDVVNGLVTIVAAK